MAIRKVKNSENKELVEAIARLRGLTYDEWLKIAEESYIKDNFSLIAKVIKEKELNTSVNIETENK